MNGRRLSSQLHLDRPFAPSVRELVHHWIAAVHQLRRRPLQTIRP